MNDIGRWKSFSDAEIGILHCGLSRLASRTPNTLRRSHGKPKEVRMKSRLIDKLYVSTIRVFGWSLEAFIWVIIGTFIFGSIPEKGLIAFAYWAIISVIMVVGALAIMFKTSDIVSSNIEKVSRHNQEASS